jgi:hypothetical protein
MASPSQTCTASDKDATEDERFGSYVCGGLEPLKLQLESGEPVQSTRSQPARVSLSPSSGKSRTNVSNVSSLEALHPPPVPASRTRNATEKKQSKRKQESMVVDVERTKVEQQLSTRSVNSKTGKSNDPVLGKNSTNVETGSSRDPLAKESPKKKTKQLKNFVEEKQAALDQHKPTPIQASKTSKKRKQIGTATEKDDDSSLGTENRPAIFPEESTIERRRSLWTRSIQSHQQWG